MMDWTWVANQRRSANWQKRGWMITVGCLASTAAISHAQGNYTVAQDLPMQTSQTTSKITERRVSVSVQNTTVRSTLANIAQQAQVRTTFYGGEQALERRISMSFKNIRLLDAMQRILEGTGLQAVLAADGSTLVISARTENTSVKSTISQATGSVTGRVVDSATGRGLAGVVVKVSGTNISKMTNGNGEFLLSDVPAGEQTIEFRIVGYRAFSRGVRVADGQTVTANVVLRPAATMLSEVVTTAIGQQQRKDIGYTVGSINVDSLRQIAPIKSVTDLLENRMPGVTVQRSSGSPGAPARIRIRGASSISENNDPVIVVDGARRYGGQSDARNRVTTGKNNDRSYSTTSPLDQIDPASIERIDILKGPAAAAMYGPDAASGVIMITTKRGQAGPPQWIVGFDARMSEYPGSWPTTTYQWVTPLVGGDPALCIGYCGDSRIDSVRKFQALNDPYLTLLGRGTSFNPSASVSGGSGQILYSFTVSSLRDVGIMKLPEIEEARYLRYQEQPAPAWMRKPERLERNSLSSNINIALDAAKKTNLVFQTNLTQEVQRKTSMSAEGDLGTALNRLQSMWIDPSQLAEASLLGNPYERVTSPQLTMSNTLSLGFEPRSWLSARVQGNMGTTTRNSQEVLKGGLMPPSPIAQDDESKGSFSSRANTTSNTSLNMRLWTPIIRKIRANAMFTYERERTDDQSGRFNGIPQGVSTPSSPADSNSFRFSRTTSEIVNFGYSFVPELVLSEKLNFTPGFRLDQNGLSGENGKLVGWPSLGGSWMLSEESFFPFKQYVDEFRVRGSFGVAGSQPTTGDLTRLFQFQTRTPVTGFEPLYGEMWELSNLGNTRLRPERVREVDMGFDVSFLDRRMNMVFSYSNKFTKDAIVSQPIASSVMGVQSLNTNVGDLENRTIELSLNSTPVESEYLGVSFGFNFSRQTSEVIRLARNAGPVQVGVSLSPDGNVRYVPGYPMEGIWMRPINGYADLDGNGWISKSELVVGQSPVFVGSTQPAYTMALSPDITLFKRFRVSAQLAHVSGQTQSLAVTGASISGGLQGGAPYMADIVFGPEGFERQAAYIAYIYGGGTQGTPIGYVQKVDVTRLEYVSLTASVSPRFTRMVKARSLDVSLRGRNLALWTNYIGVDPNVNSQTSNAGLFDSGQLPSPREWSINFNLRY